MATQKQINANKKNGKKGGRKPGSVSAATLEKIAVGKVLQQKILGVADTLFKKKLQLACGQSFLYKIEKYWEGEGKSKKLRQKPPKLVTSASEIEEHLQEAITSDYDHDDYESTYYFITTKEPNNAAIEDLLDRGLGRVAQSIKGEDEEGNTVPITGLLIVQESSRRKDK